MKKSTPKKVAILGGGVGAMTAAFELTQEDDWQHKYDISVYQLGWRLGGKGASGRDLTRGARILEHGLHVWGGFYDNSFRLLRQCYEALQRPPGVPIRSIEQAFRGVDQVYLSDLVGDQPHVWRVDFPPNDEVPGSGGEYLSPRDYLIELLEGLAGLIERFPIGPPPGPARLFATLPAELAAHLSGLPAAHRLSHLHAAAATARRLPQGAPAGPLLHLLQWLLSGFQKHLAARTAAAAMNPTLGSVLAALEIGAACAKGLIADQVLEHGFDPLDEFEWSEWVMKHGASRKALQSSVGRCAYDYVFGWRGGIADFEHRAVGAGAATRAMLRLLFTYKGSLFFKLNAGMGDIVFAPIYELLHRRGVKFRFFHKVTNLGLAADGRRIETIGIERQVDLNDTRKDAEYKPLVDCGGLPCWPATPKFKDIKDGDKIEKLKINLESMWSGWKSVEHKTLQAGEDFDLVVLGISLGGLKAITPELAQRHRRWHDMLDKVQTVATQAMQFWFDRKLGDLGWPADSGLLTSYYEPLDTWSDMSFLLPREGWDDKGPRQISYFCSTFEPTEPAPPFGKNRYPQRQLEAMKAAARPWIDRRLTQLLPKTEGAQGKFDCGTLYAPGCHGDEARLAEQYWRVNVDPPSELYVQSVPGSTRYRLTADGSGIDNLFLAGDWVRTGINAGCVEAATMAGLQTARAISGRDIPIVGESDLAESPLAAQNAGLPWSLVYAQGQICSAIVTLALPIAEVRKLLGPGLKLLPQNLSPAGTHPLGLIFADQSQVRANVMPVGGMSYRECAIAIPHVGLADAPQATSRPLMLLPALYLDRVLPTLAGRLFYGYRKHLARADGPVPRRQVAELASGDMLLRARLVGDGAAGSPYDFEHLAALRDMMRQPIVTPDPLRGWLYSFLDYRFELARITPLRGGVEAAAAVLGNGTARSWPVESVRASALGAFQFDGDWTLTNPFESHALEAMIARQRGPGRR